jgi:Terminase large subunit, T4likevirus-type, N-terminal
MDAELTNYKEIELELRRREHDDPLGLTYHPHQVQQECHRDRHRFLLVVGGNRSGKTWYAVAEALYYCLGRTIWAETPKPAVVWYVMPSLPMFRRTILPVFKRLCPKKELISFSERKGVAKFKNGSELHFLSSDMRQRRLQGASIDLAIMDETPEESVFDELQARVFDRHGRVIMVFAPIDIKSFWVRDKIYIPWTAGENTDFHVIHMPVADREGHSLVPHFSDADIKAMERQWPDPNIRAARMYGEFITRTGLVFRSFDPDTHLIPRFEIPVDYARWFSCDPQYHRFAVLYYAADDVGNYYITDEFFSQDDTLARRAERMAAIAGKRDRAVPCYVDSANPQDTAELNWHFQRIGAPIGAVPLPMRKRIEDMVLRTHALLEPDPEKAYPVCIPGFEEKRGQPLVYGAPRLFFFNDLMSSWKWDERDMLCSRLLWEMQRLSWGENGKPDKESADGGDACDTLVYGCSILSSGVRREEPQAWLKKLPIADQLIWAAIQQQDRYRAVLIREG